MNLFRGLLSVAIFYGFMFGIYEWGFRNGIKTEKPMRIYASNGWENCNKVIRK